MYKMYKMYKNENELYNQVHIKYKIYNDLFQFSQYAECGIG